MAIALPRSPTLQEELRSAIVYASVPVLISALAAFGWMTSEEPPPGWFRYAAAPFLALATLGFLVNVVRAARRAASGRVPAIETQWVPWRPGAKVPLRITDPDAPGLSALDVFLVAEGVTVERVPLTTASSGGWRFTETVLHQVPLLSLGADELRAGPLDRTVDVAVPPEAANRNWRWAVLLMGTGARGLPREDRYPVPVQPDAALRS